jgi:5'-nucleotidase
MVAEHGRRPRKKEVKAMRILVTNDDGIDAVGMSVLETVLSEWGQTVTVAPEEELSGCSHQVTMSRPLKLTPVGPRRFALDGTPADCVRVGLSQVAPQTDWVVAGINAGGNLGVDVLMSGTVAAVREATLLGVPAIAVSQFRRTKAPVDWQTAQEQARRVLVDLLERRPAGHEFWNVNLPDTVDTDGDPEVVFCPSDPKHLLFHYEETPEGLLYRGSYQARARTPGADVDVCFSGKIAVSLIRWPG